MDRKERRTSMRGENDNDLQKIIGRYHSTYEGEEFFSSSKNPVTGTWCRFDE
jgi:hypothetical protein